jgi:hypothetical protein
MGDVSVVRSNAGGALAEIARFARFTQPDFHRKLLEDAGKFMAFQVVPMRFRESGPDADGEPWLNVARGGKPLVKDGIMQTRTDYEVRGDESVAIGNSAKQARLQNRGGPRAGQKTNAKLEAKAFEHYREKHNPAARSGSLGWMYVKARGFLYFGEYALGRIVERWRALYGEA